MALAKSFDASAAHPAESTVWLRSRSFHLLALERHLMQSGEYQSMEHWLTFLAIFLLLGAVCALPASTEQWKEFQAGVAIPMRDGRALIADVYLPQQPGVYPCVLIQTPYGRDRFGPAMPAIGTGRDDGLLDRTRYACVIADWRGFFDSAPAGEGIARPRYGQDGHDLVEWIARQSWSNGKVGTWGPSALGRVQYWTARTRPPHLTCCMPLVAAEGPVYDEYYENGVYREAHVKIMERLGFPISAAAAAATRPNSLIYRLTARLDDPRRYQAPFQIMTGWYDPGVAAQIRAFETLHARAEGATRAYSKLIIGPWHHTGIGLARQGALTFPGAAPERDQATRLFLDYWLSGDRNGWDARPAFRWWQMGENRWLAADSPSAVRTTARQFFLHGNCLMDERQPAAAEPVREYLDDPLHPAPTRGGANIGQGSAGGMLLGPQDQRPLEQRDDVLVYTTAALTEPLRLFGRVTLHFTFAIDRPDASFAARLCDVYPDGRSMLICDGITRALCRDGAENPQPATPGVCYATALSLPPTAITLPPGHCLRLSIAGSNYPRFERNGHTGEIHYNPDTAVPAHCTLYHDAAHPMTLTVPVLAD